MKTKFIVTALAILLVANVLIMFVYPFGIHAEGFQARLTEQAKKKTVSSAKNMKLNSSMTSRGGSSSATPSASDISLDSSGSSTSLAKPGLRKLRQGFKTYVSAQAGGAGKSYEPMGAYDNVSLPTGNDSSWRYTAPNEPLMGPAFEPGPDSLFMFKNNQCKPECCGASFSCDGGCVCTSPEQRQYIASRGGNRTAPEDSA
jgi:hypothetical protein